MAWSLVRRFHGWPLVRRFAPHTKDRAVIRLPGFDLLVQRTSTLLIPSELTVVVPRAELRASYKTPDGGQACLELVLNSVTVVDSPRHSGREAPPRSTATRVSGPAGT